LANHDHFAWGGFEYYCRHHIAVVGVVFEGLVDVTGEFEVCYNPNSDNVYWGASITATRDGGLNPNPT
jgi:hypothetical protein